MATFTGRVTKIEVQDTGETASVVIDPPGPNPSGTFKVTNDDDSSYGAMMSVLTISRAFGLVVTADHAADKEINKLSL